MSGSPDPLTWWLGLDFTAPERRYNPEIRDFLAELLGSCKDFDTVLSLKPPPGGTGRRSTPSISPSSACGSFGVGAPKGLPWGWAPECEIQFSVMVRSLGLHRIAAFPSGKHLAARSYWGLVVRVNLIRKVASLTLVHNLIRSRVLLRMAGVEL
jgi:hypothetical protein